MENIKIADRQIRQEQLGKGQGVQIQGAKTQMGWRSAQDLKPGDKIITKDGRIGTVKAVKAAPGLHTVHNFAVEQDHTYFVGDGPGVWVHNTYGRALEKQHDLTPAQERQAKQLGVSFTEGTENLNPEDANRVISERIAQYLEKSGMSESQVIEGGTLEGAMISKAVYNDMNLNAIEGTGLSLQKTHRLLIDKAYRNEMVETYLTEKTINKIKNYQKHFKRIEIGSEGEMKLKAKGAQIHLEPALRQARNIQELLHYDLRKALNVDLPKNHAAMKTLRKNDKRWGDVDPEEAILHQNADGIQDHKYVHIDGREVVYDGVTGAMITDDEIIGTFNYSNVADSFMGVEHKRVDINPWIKMGNTRMDRTTRSERQYMFNSGVVDAVLPERGLFHLVYTY